MLRAFGKKKPALQLHSSYRDSGGSRSRRLKSTDMAEVLRRITRPTNGRAMPAASDVILRD